MNTSQNVVQKNPSPEIEQVLEIDKIEKYTVLHKKKIYKFLLCLIIVFKSIFT